MLESTGIGKTFGVIAAEVNNIEQREIMKGIIEKAQALSGNVVVFSNIYNPYALDDDLAYENQIYDLMLSPELDGLILISESFTNAYVQQTVKEHLARVTDIPIVIIGTRIPMLEQANACFINSSDVNDMDDIVTHLLEKHGMKKIDLLTGMGGNDAADLRVQGYRSALTRHGIPFEPNRVHYGDFWLYSGENLAKRYLSGELPLPDAVVCANDYMAYGLLDTLIDGGIRVPEDVTVVGYEYIFERIYHSPLLSTYRRNRSALGAMAVEIIERFCNGEPQIPFQPPRGTWVAGESCPCGTDREMLNAELKYLRAKQTYDKQNVMSTLEQNLTRCSNLDDFVSVLGEHQVLVRWVQNMYLCLYDNWYDTHATATGDLLSCRSIMPWNRMLPTTTCHKYQFSNLFADAPHAAAYYYLPLFFEKRLFGYFVLRYDAPDTYDDIFRNWMKAVSNGLAFLCMKNDIRYLLHCQNLSTVRDTLTGLNNQVGFEKAILARMAVRSAPVTVLVLRIGLFSDLTNSAMHERQTQLCEKIAELLRRICPKNGTCARLDAQTFACAGWSGCEEEEMLQKERLTALLLHQPEYLERFGMESFAVCSVAYQPEMRWSDWNLRQQEQMDRAIAKIALQKTKPHAENLFAIRNQLYQDHSLDTDCICKQYSFSAGYFRQIYRDCFGISFHQDAIRARVSYAVFLLSTTVLSTASVAEQCGYEDYNYFLRQFQKVTGMTPNQYRRAA